MGALILPIIRSTDHSLIKRRGLVVSCVQQLRLPGLVEGRDVDSLLVELVQILNSSLQFLQLVLILSVLFFQAGDVRVELFILGTVTGGDALLQGRIPPAILALAARVAALLHHVALFRFPQMIFADCPLLAHLVVGVAVANLFVIGTLVGDQASFGIRVWDRDLDRTLRSLALLQAPITFASRELLIFPSVSFAFIFGPVWLVLGLHPVDSLLDRERLLALQMIACCKIVGESGVVRFIHVIRPAFPFGSTGAVAVFHLLREKCTNRGDIIDIVGIQNHRRVMVDTVVLLAVVVVVGRYYASTHASSVSKTGA